VVVELLLSDIKLYFDEVFSPHSQDTEDTVEDAQDRGMHKFHIILFCGAASFICGSGSGYKFLCGSGSCHSK
jgi:hypothetical protein